MFGMRVPIRMLSAERYARRRSGGTRCPQAPRHSQCHATKPRTSTASPASWLYDELAFYDAVCQNGSAILELGDDTVKAIAQALIRAVRESARIDWNLKESVPAGLRAKVKRLFARYDYTPDKEERAIELVLEQSQLFAEAEAA